MNLNHVAKKPFLDLFYRKPCMPHFLKAALYDSGTVVGSTVVGSRGVLRFNTELQRANDPQLNEAINMIKKIKTNGNHVTALLSYADIIQLGGYTAVEYCGGPSMIFKMGRQDVETEGEASNALAIMPDSSHESAVMVKKFDMMGLQPEEYVAIMGSHTLGFASDDNKGKTGRWTMNPYVFDNSYFKEVLLGHDSIYLKTEADLRLLQDSQLRQWVETYASDQKLFFENYARAHVKISERGQEENMVSEFDESDIIDGGYQENKGAHWTKQFSEEEENLTKDVTI